MAAITYRKTHFSEPDKIPTAGYLHYKKLIAEDPDFQIIDDLPEFTNRFRRSLKNLSWLLPSFLLISLFFGLFLRPSIHPPDAFSISIVIADGILAVMTFGLLLQILLEGPSYATFIKDKRNYFNQMKTAIENSRDYQSFYTDFYTSAKRHLTKVPASSPGKEKKQTPSLDSVLTETFHWIDKYWWIVCLVGLALFFGRKILFQD